MNRADLKNQIYVFRAQVDNYRRAVLQMPEDHYGKNYEHYETMMNIHRSQLNQAYGKIERYIDKIGGGVGQTYLEALGDGPLGDVISAISSVLQNLDRIIGRIDGMSEEEFENLFVVNQQVTTIAPPTEISIKDVKNPHRAYWKLLFGDAQRWISENKIISTVVVGLIIAYIVYLFGWNK